VLDWDEAPHHPHNAARAAFVDRDGVVQPAPAIRLSRSAADIRWEDRTLGRDEVFADWGIEG
jgi:alpha-methylacyl-CoA racemase